jgi:asparagine synthase (glutamine-hydrolysing)
MDIIFGCRNLTNRVTKLEMSAYFGHVFSTLSLSDPISFTSAGFGIATASHARNSRYRSANIFQDPRSRVLVTVNGDLINHQELEKELRTVESPGPNGARSTAELIYEMYAVYGLGFASRLNGVVSIAIWHELEKRLILIPDAFGFRPFYYFEDSSLFVFATSIKAILAYPGVTRAVDTDALHQLLVFGFVLPPDHLFKGLKTVSAGEYLEFADVSVIQSLPSRVVLASDGYHEQQTPEEYLELLKDAVSMTVGGAERVSVLLSGGVDSSAVVTLLRDIGVRDIVTYSMHLDQENSEDLDAAREVARLFGTKHMELTELGPSCLNDLPEIAWQLEVPRVEVVAEYAFCDFLDSEGSPVLTGDGNDIPWGLLSPAFTEDKGLLELYLLLRRRMTDEEARSLVGASKPGNARLADIIAAESPDGCNSFQTLIGLDRKLFGAHFVNRMLGKIRIENRSLEFRFPFLDKRIAEFVGRLPDAAKARRSDGRMIFKYLFKRAMEKHGSLPQRIIHQKKTWMHHPTAKWFRGEVGAQLREWMFEPANHALQYFDAGHTARLWAEHRDGKKDHSYALETTFTFCVWHKIFIESRTLQRPGVSLMDLL